MAKVFKVIMNILIILFIVALVALFVPPLLGITTVTAKPDVETNMQTGSVAYGVREPLSSLKVGDTIISSTESETWLYEITQIDATAGELTVRSSETAEPETIMLRRTASKKVLVVPFIGYIIIALQTTEGMIILGLIAALLVILFIIADILCRKAKDKETDEDDEDDELSEEEQDRRYFSDLAASQSRPSRLDELGTISIPPVADMMESDPDHKRANTLELDEELETPELILETVSSAQNTVSTDATQKVVLPGEEPVKEEAGDTEHEMTVDLVEPEETPEAQTPAPEAPAKPDSEKEPPKEESPSAKADAKKAPTKETAPAEKAAPAEQAAPVEKAAPIEQAAPAEKTAPSADTSELSGIGSALENVLDSGEMNRTARTDAPAAAAPEPVPETPAEEIELAIPQRTLDELLQEAYANGEDPKVTKDAAIGVTFVDYSNCL